MNGFGLTEILTIAGTAGGTLLLVRFILANHDRRLTNLECFKAKVRMPNVGEPMCDTRHRQLEQALRHMFETNEKVMGRIDKDHDMLTTLATKLDNISEKLDRLNGI